MNVVLSNKCRGTIRDSKPARTSPYDGMEPVLLLCPEDMHASLNPHLPMHSHIDQDIWCLTPTFGLYFSAIVYICLNSIDLQQYFFYLVLHFISYWLLCKHIIVSHIFITFLEIIYYV